MPGVGGVLPPFSCECLLGSVLDLLHAQTWAAADDLYTALCTWRPLGKDRSGTSR